MSRGLPRFPSMLLTLAILGLFGLPCKAKDSASKTLTKVKDLTKGETLTLEARGYFRYWVTIQDCAVQGAGESEPYENSFELWRFYFGAKARLNGWLKARFLTDVGPEKDTKISDGEGGQTTLPGDSRYLAYVKYAYLEAALAPGLHLQAGVIGNPYNSFVDDYWGHRFVAKNLGDDQKWWDSADVGINLGYDIGEGIGQVSVGVANGAGYKAALDEDANKRIWVYGMFSPLKALGKAGESLKIGGFLQSDLSWGDGRATMLMSPFVGYSFSVLTLGYQFVALDPDSESSSNDWTTGHALYLRMDTSFHVGLLAKGTLFKTESDGPFEMQALLGLYARPASFLNVAVSGVATWLSKDTANEETEPEITLLISSELSF